MPAPSKEPDDDAIADALADAWLREAESDPHVRARLADLIARNAEHGGWEPELRMRSVADTARACGVSEGTVCNMISMFRARYSAKVLTDSETPVNLITLARKVLSTL